MDQPYTHFVSFQILYILHGFTLMVRDIKWCSFIITIDYLQMFIVFPLNL